MDKDVEILDGESKVDELYLLCDDPMKFPIKIIDEKFNFVDLNVIQDLFVENSGFLVVGVLGLQVIFKNCLNYTEYWEI